MVGVASAPGKRRGVLVSRASETLNGLQPPNRWRKIHVFLVGGTQQLFIHFPYNLS